MLSFFEPIQNVNNSGKSKYWTEGIQGIYGIFWCNSDCYQAFEPLVA
jgi:hypothetical protein